MKHLSTIIALAATLGVSSATAAGITIQGAVSTSAAITVSPTAPYNVLDLGSDQTDLKVASVNEKCNKHNGYTVTLASENAVSNGGGTVAKLVGALASPESLSYTMKYNSAAVTLVGGSATVANETTKTLGIGVNKDLSISYLGAAANLAADTYSDTLTLTIAAK